MSAYDFFARRKLGSTVAAFVLSACAADPGSSSIAREPAPGVQPPSQTQPEPRAVTDSNPCEAETVQQGKASWYGDGFKGEKTASGERFDPNARTAAHPSLPLGTPIQVTNLENGKETTLVVNDRGPHVKGRVLDVSKKGAQELGFVSDGTAPVRIAPLASGCDTRTEAAQ